MQQGNDGLGATRSHTIYRKLLVQLDGTKQDVAIASSDVLSSFLVSRTCVLRDS